MESPTNNRNTCDLLVTDGIVITDDDERRVIDAGAISIQGEEILSDGTSKNWQN